MRGAVSDCACCLTTCDWRCRKKDEIPFRLFHIILDSDYRSLVVSGAFDGLSKWRRLYLWTIQHMTTPARTTQKWLLWTTMSIYRRILVVFGSQTIIKGPRKEYQMPISYVTNLSSSFKKGNLKLWCCSRLRNRSDVARMVRGHVTEFWSGLHDSYTSSRSNFRRDIHSAGAAVLYRSARSRHLPA